MRRTSDVRQPASRDDVDIENTPATHHQEMNAMKGTQAATRVESNTLAVTALQGDAWAAWNASYTAPEREAYQTVSMALYRQDVHERIERLLERSDEQNRRLDTLLPPCA